MAKDDDEATPDEDEQAVLHGHRNSDGIKLTKDIVPGVRPRRRKTGQANWLAGCKITRVFDRAMDGHIASSTTLSSDKVVNSTSTDNSCEEKRLAPPPLQGWEQVKKARLRRLQDAGCHTPSQLQAENARRKDTLNERRRRWQHTA